MTSAVSQCSLYSDQGFWPGNWQLTSNIKKNTTPKDFDKQRSTYPDHQWSHGAGCRYTVLAAAAAQGNNVLLLHIIGIADKSLLDTGDVQGRTPLYFAAERRQYTIAQELLSQKANVNISTKDWSTPVQIAAETNYLAMVILLLMNGALLPTCKEAPALSAKARQCIEQAQKQIHDSRAQFFTVKFAEIDKGTTPMKLPKPMLEIIAGYADFNEEWTTAFNDEDATSVSNSLTGSSFVNKCRAYVGNMMG